MTVGIKEDFSTNAALDSELMSTPTSGLYLNGGVHPCVTVNNLLSFLPLLDVEFVQWQPDTVYGKYSDTKKRSDIVKQGVKIYQSLQAGTNHDPEEVGSAYWLETNIESLRLKSFIDNVLDRMLTELNLNRRLVNSQYIYEVGGSPKQLPSDYAAWVFEPKGSDHVTIRINQIAIQKSGTDPVNLYVVRQGKLLQTIQITPTDGTLEFSDIDLTITGKGITYLVIDSTEVIAGNYQVDPLRYDGFVAYTATGTGGSPQGATYSHGASGNGLGFCISVHLDAKQYVSNNLPDFGNFFRATVEYMAFEHFLANPNNRSNRSTLLQMSEEVLLAELKNVQANTVAMRFSRERKRAMNAIEKTFDTHLSEGDGLEITVGSL